MRRVPLLGLVLAIYTPSSTRADILRPKEGGEIVAPSRVEGTDVIVTTAMGDYRFPRADFREIVPRPDPAREWPERRDRALKGDAPDRCKAALWALDFGLVPECDAMIRAAHAADPTHQPSARMVAALDRLKPPCPEPAIPPLLRGLPSDVRIARGPHTLLIHQHTEAEAAERLAHLEQVTTAFYLYFASLGFDLPAPTDRLPSAWFARKADYIAFLRAEGATAFLTTRGYYHPTRRLVIAYDARDDPTRLNARQALLAAREELARFEPRIEAIPANARARVTLRGTARTVDRAGARALLASLRRELDRQELVLELTRREIDWGVAAHESAHQLVAQTRLAPRHDAWPNWLHEGLAMQFEPIEGGRWSGLHPPSPSRLRDYRALKTQPSLPATLRDTDSGPGYDASVYARDWALIYYLRIDRPNAFLSLLDGLAIPLAGHANAATRAASILTGHLSEGEEARWHKALDLLASGANPAAPPRILIDRAARDGKMQRSNDD